MRTSLFIFLALGLAACSTGGSANDGGASDAGGSDAGAHDAGASCPAPSGSGTSHTSSISADETWTAAGSPHLVPSSLTINAGATLTIEPCAQVQLGAGAAIYADGKLVARGTATQPIVIDARDATAPWSYLAGSAGGSIDLAYASLLHGGNTDINGYGAIDVRGDTSQPIQSALRVQNVTIDGSRGFGVSVRYNAGFTADSTGLVIRNAASGPVRTSFELAGTLPQGTYTGNGVNEILVVAEGTYITNDVTFHALGVPYRIGDSGGTGKTVIVGGTAAGARSTLTLEPGVELRFNSGGSLTFNAPGSGQAATGVLVAHGGTAGPVTFTSGLSPQAAGDWQGLVFNGVPDPSDSLDDVVIAYAGGPSYASSFHCDPNSTGFSPDEDAALAVYGQPASSFVTNSTFRDSAADGVDRAYSGTPVDFMPTNTFVNIARCKQSYPRASDGSCPTQVPCP